MRCPFSLYLPDVPNSTCVLPNGEISKALGIILRSGSLNNIRPTSFDDRRPVMFIIIHEWQMSAIPHTELALGRIGINVKIAPVLVHF